MLVPSRRSFALLIALLAFSSAALADQIVLKNGDRLSGAVENSDGKILTFKSDLAGEVKIQWDAVTSITSTQNLHLAMKGGQTLVGSVTTIRHPSHRRHEILGRCHRSAE